MAAADWPALLAVLLLCGHASLLVRAARLQPSAAPALAAVGVVLAASVPLAGVLSNWVARVPPAPVLAALGLALAIRVRLERPVGPEQWAWDAALGAAVPLAVLCVLPLYGDARDSVPAAIIALALAAGAVVLHLRGRRSEPRPSSGPRP